jgi:hypothetical protein
VARKYLLCLFVLMCWVIPITAQDYTFNFTKDGDQGFLNFDGVKGQAMYLLADFTEIIFGAELELDIRDANGRSVGYKDEYSFQPFVFVDIPETGKYVAVVTYRGDEPAEVKAMIGLTAYLEQGKITVEAQADDFFTMLGVRPEESGNFVVTVKRTDGELATSFVIRQFDEFIPSNVLEVSGTGISEWSAHIHLEADGRYFAFLDENFFREPGSDAIIEITLTKG